MTGRALETDRPTKALYACCARATSTDSHPGAPKATGLSVPSPCTIARTGSCSSRHHVTSVTSPNVQIIAIPLPFAGSANAWDRTGTETPNSGVITCCPKSGW